MTVPFARFFPSLYHFSPPSTTSAQQASVNDAFVHQPKNSVPLRDRRNIAAVDKGSSGLPVCACALKRCWGDGDTQLRYDAAVSWAHSCSRHSRDGGTHVRHYAAAAGDRRRRELIGGLGPRVAKRPAATVRVAPVVQPRRRCWPRDKGWQICALGTGAKCSLARCGLQPADFPPFPPSPNHGFYLESDFNMCTAERILLSYAYSSIVSHFLRGGEPLLRYQNTEHMRMNLGKVRLNGR